MSDKIKKVAVAGSGTMGRGIAQVSAKAGFATLLYDINEKQLMLAQSQTEQEVQKLVEKGKLTSADADQLFKNLSYCSRIEDVQADLIIEAIIEKLDVKKEFFSQVALQNTSETILASNTSSLNITLMAAATPQPQHFVGLHFFNPATIMPLVEIVRTEMTDPSTLETIESFVNDIKKEYVHAKDSPGFIVNRVARHFYVESLKILEEGVASPEEIDCLMESVGFKMGPFKLMDLIGNDINLSVTESLFNAFDQDPKFRPSRIQRAKVQAGKLGRKTGEGFYKYEKK